MGNVARVDGQNVNLNDRVALIAAMEYKAEHIKAKADPELFYAVADALENSAPVVRCKDCMCWESGENEGEKWEWCTLHGIDIGPHSFCSYGERKEVTSDG